MVMNNGSFLVIKNNAYLVLDNSNANALTQTGTGGKIISETETNRLRWNVSNATGSYIVPFYDDDNASKIPVTLNISSAGTAGASNHIDFSTYDGTTWDNASFMPSGVANMGSIVVPTANNSNKVIDRFWVLDANHAVKPAVTLSFTYIDAEVTAVGNSIAEANLRAQRWNSTLSDWDPIGFAPTGIANNLLNTVSNIIVPSADFFKSWTLVDNATPLPIELLSNEANCLAGSVVFKWSTASETNNDFFTIERSGDGLNFEAIGTVPAAGNNTSVLNYSFTDYSPYSQMTYYRLKQTDYNGESETFPMVSVMCSGQATADFSLFPNPSTGIFSVSGVEANSSFSIINVIGEQLMNGQTINDKTQIDLSNFANGIYFIEINNNKIKQTKKIIKN
jgi:hypothetical protein